MKNSLNAIAGRASICSLNILWMHSEVDDGRWSVGNGQWAMWSGGPSKHYETS